MELLLTRKKPLVVTNNDFLEAFEDYSSSADSVHVSTGYVSVESLQYLLENAKKGVLPYLDLTIGMHHFDDFTKAQYDCAKSLADYLASSKRGSASICVSFPYHGKVYSFHKEGKPFVAIIGSSNLSGLLGSRDSYNFDVDVALEDPAVLNQLSDFQSDLKDKACKSLDDWEPTRKNVIDQEALIPIIGDSNSYFEGGSHKNTATIDAMLGLQDREEELSVDKAIEILKMIDPEEDADQEDLDLYIGCLKALGSAGDRLCYLIVRTDRDLTKGTGSLLSPNDRDRGASITDKTVLTLYRVNGQQEKGWLGFPLWIPNLKFPKGRCFYAVS